MGTFCGYDFLHKNKKPKEVGHAVQPQSDYGSGEATAADRDRRVLTLVIHVLFVDHLMRAA